LKSAKIAKLKRFIFFSIANAHYYPNIYLINLKFQFEKVLASSKVPYTIFRINNFLQTIISEYSRRVLDENAVWVKKKEEEETFSYIDVCAVATLCLNSFSLLKTVNKSFTFVDKSIPLKREIENLCKAVVGPLSQVLQIPGFVISSGNNSSYLLESFWNDEDSFSYFDTLTAKPGVVPYNFYLNKFFRVKSKTFYSYENYIRDYLDLILLDLQRLHKSSI
jgi:hypothetical protein